MNDVYEVIDTLRKHKNMTGKKLAELAGMPVTTLATIMGRKPVAIPKKHLVALANALGVQWYELLNVSECAYPDGAKIPSKLSPHDVEEIMHNLIGYDEHCDVRYNVIGRGTSGPERQRIMCEYGMTMPGTDHDEEYVPACDVQYRHSIIFMLNRLNTEGLLEAMHQVAAIARDPNLCRGNTKEDTIWQKEKLPMAAEHSENERMVVGKDSTSSDEIPEQEC